MDAGDWGRARALLPRGVLTAVWIALLAGSLVLIAGLQQPDVVVAASAPVATAVATTVPAAVTVPSRRSTSSVPAVVPVAVCWDDDPCGAVVVASIDP